MFALKKENKRFLLGLCALIVAVAMVSIGVTLAYAPVTAYETNVVVLGNISIRLNDKYYSYINTPDDIEDEDTDPGDIVYDTDTETPYNEDDPPTFSPGQTVRKVVSVNILITLICLKMRIFGVLRKRMKIMSLE